MNRLLLSVCLTLAIARVDASESLRETMKVDGVRIEVTWIGSSDEMDSIVRGYGHRVQGDRGIGMRTKGFSVLGRRNGELVCLIYSHKPKRFEDDAAATLGHELLHCFGFSHD